MLIFFQFVTTFWYLLFEEGRNQQEVKTSLVKCKYQSIAP